jgi:hypothetical protein
MTGHATKKRGTFKAPLKTAPVARGGDCNILKKWTNYGDVRILPLRPLFQRVIVSMFRRRNEMRNEIRSKPLEARWTFIWSPMPMSSRKKLALPRHNAGLLESGERNGNGPWRRHRKK